MLVLIVDAQPERLQLRALLKMQSMQTVVARSPVGGLLVADTRHPSGIIVSARTAGAHLGELLRVLHDAVPRAAIMVVHEDEGSRTTAVTCFEYGVAGYFDARDRARLGLWLGAAIRRRAASSSCGASARAARLRHWRKRRETGTFLPSRRRA